MKSPQNIFPLKLLSQKLQMTKSKFFPQACSSVSFHIIDHSFLKLLSITGLSWLSSCCCNKGSKLSGSEVHVSTYRSGGQSLKLVSLANTQVSQGALGEGSAEHSIQWPLQWREAARRPGLESPQDAPVSGSCPHHLLQLTSPTSPL